MNTFVHLIQGCHGQGKYLENEIFPGQGKVREFCGWPGKFRKDLESQEKSGNLKINSCDRQSSEKLFKRVMDIFLMR